MAEDTKVFRRKAPRLALSVVLAWEATVVDKDLPAYDRMYAWWQCVRVWSSLRFDDHRGLVPCAMSMEAGNFKAILTRTKTSGQDKRVEALPVHVSAKAYLGFKDWLSVGYALWAAVPGERDFFLLMPDEDRSGTRRIEVTYADAMTMSRSLMVQLRRVRWEDHKVVKGDEELLSCGLTAAFWTEHSPRSTLPSWVACLGKFPIDWCDLLGRWGSSRGEGYVRTHRARVHLMQEAVSENFRSCASPHALYDEQALFTELRDFLEKKEVDEAMREVQIGNLTLDGDGVPLAEAAVENPTGRRHRQRRGGGQGGAGEQALQGRDRRLWQLEGHVRGGDLRQDQETTSSWTMPPRSGRGLRQVRGDRPHGAAGPHVYGEVRALLVQEEEGGLLTDTDGRVLFNLMQLFLLSE